MELLSFRQIAALAVRKSSVDILTDGMKQLTEAYRYNDDRDVITDLSLFYNSAQKLGLNGDTFLSQFTNSKNDDFNKLVLGFIKRSPHDKSIKAMGYEEVLSPFFDYKMSF